MSDRALEIADRWAGRTGEDCDDVEWLLAERERLDQIGALAERQLRASCQTFEAELSRLEAERRAIEACSPPRAELRCGRCLACLRGANLSRDEKLLEAAEVGGRLLRERDEARAEAERLTAERGLCASNERLGWSNEEATAFDEGRAEAGVDLARMRSALKTIDEDFDHEEQTREHGPRNADGMPRYGGICRCCEAHRALTGEEWNP